MDFQDILYAKQGGVATITINRLGVGGLSLYYGTEEATEGKNAFLERRPPDYQRFRRSGGSGTDQG